MRSAAAVLLGLVLAACGDASSPSPDGKSVSKPDEVVVRIGHFPNITHAHGLVAHATSRTAAASGTGTGWFEERLGPGVKVEWYGSYNAGPSAMEAMLAGSLDLCYVGPNPALNAHVRSKAEEIRVISGATRGGSALVVREAAGIRAPADFKGRRVATPQLGNTQDVACRAWLMGQGFSVRLTGGDVTVLPTHNPDQLLLFQSGDLDAAWTVEPWVSRLESEGGGRVFLEEKDALTTVLVVSTRFQKAHPGLAKGAVAAHRALTQWIAANPEEAKARVRDQMRAITTREVPKELLDRCWARMRFEDAVAREDFEAFVAAAGKAGLLAEAHDVSRLVEVP